ncbi:MAG TPA: ABC transporter ATP-binding protein [Polyangiales bacterium]|nr:ABC transporter ATP-binding protein [Polyangiales bacterium]
MHSSTRPAAPSLEVISMTMRFGAFTALDTASMKVRAGAFHALLGENGAGKSTLVKCVIGYQRPTSGDVLLDNKQVIFDSPRMAHAAGIGMVYQHFTLVQNMTVAENLVLVRDHVPAFIDWKAEHKKLEAFMDQMPFRVPLTAAVSSLAAGEKQKLEILKQLYLGRKLLFLDEPTSVLTPSEADEVLGLLHAMTREQKLTVLIITHKFREVMAFCDEVSVLRRGKLVGSGKTKDLGTAGMAELMIGNETLRKTAERTTTVPKPAKLVVEKVRAMNDAGSPTLRGLSVSVCPGEIVGVAGVSGNGQSALVEVLAGQRTKASGTVEVDGTPYTAQRSELRAKKVNVLPEVPLDNACVPGMSVSDNMALRDFDLPPIRLRGGFMSKRAIRDKAERLITRFGVKTPSPTTPIRHLSGGNVQRAVLARELCDACDVLIVANPCFGLDFAASAEIRAQIVDARNRGTAVLLISEDLDELMELSDRLCVMFEGAIVFETKPPETDPLTLGRYMAGHA